MTTPISCRGCVHVSKSDGDPPCCDCSDARLFQLPAPPSPEPSDLEVWRQAYLAALSGYDVAEVLSGFEHSKYTGASSPKELADRALADYRAKREEMRR